MNKFNPWLISLPLFLGIFLYANTHANTVVSVASVQSEHFNDETMQKMILHYVNIYRAKHHLNALKLNVAVSREATQHSRAMASKSIPFGHTQFNERVKRLYKEFKNHSGAAENVAYYKLNAKHLVDAWISSPGHRHNIEGPYNLTGIGIAHGKTGWAYFTQIFIRVKNKAYV